MTAYGAVISLKNKIDYVLHSCHFSLADPSPKIIKLAYNQLQPFQEILEKLDSTRTSRSRKKVNALDGRINKKIWEFEDKLESLLYQQILPQFPATEQVELTTRRSREPMLFSIDLRCLQDDVASFIKALKDMKREYIIELENMPQEPISTTIGFDYGLSKSKMIGLSDQFQQLKDEIMNRRHHRMYVHQIIGMAGIGKTTLAKELYEDADIVSHFDCRAWVTVTRTMVDRRRQLKKVVQGIVNQLCGNTHNYFEGKKCIIVLDDVWETQVLDSLIDSITKLPMEFVQIFYTTRGINKSEDCVEKWFWNRMFYSSRHINNSEDFTTAVRFLNEEESKDLLCHKVFGGIENCPIELDKAATKIAKKCEGLPLMIVTVADILSESQNREPDYWDDVAEERISVFTDAYKAISKVLYPSYDYLPQFLKMPFLFMGVFPPDYEISESKLINMLNAEGWFLDKNKKESSKGSFLDCSYQLCKSRHLVLFKRKSVYWDAPPYDSIYKTYRLHSSWRYLCREEASTIKFYHVLQTIVDSSEEGVKGQRGLCLQNNILFGFKEFCNSLRSNCASFARSLLFLGPYHQYPTSIDVGFRLLRELDALQLRFYTFPTEILTLVQLKHLALTCNGELPSTISKLFNLRVLIIHPHMSIRHRRDPAYVPTQIWDMQELEHIEILGKSLRVANHVASLENLSTLVGVNASICTILELSTKIPNIRKLGVRVELTPYDDYNNLLSCFGHISTLESLDTLKYSIINPVIKYGYIACARPSSLMLPRGLKKLHLSGMGFPWEYMDVIGSLPYLEVLKLRSYAFRGSTWEAPQVGRFPRLRFLLIEDSDLVCLNLSCRLTRVSLKHCYKLEKIYWPSSYNSIGRKLELEDCNPLAFTCAKELEPNEDAFLDVTISSSFEKKPVIINFKRAKKKYEPEPDLQRKMVGYTYNIEKAKKKYEPEPDLAKKKYEREPNLTCSREIETSELVREILKRVEEVVKEMMQIFKHGEEITKFVPELDSEPMLPRTENLNRHARARKAAREGCPRVCSWGDLRVGGGRRGNRRDGWRWNTLSRVDRARRRASGRF